MYSRAKEMSTARMEQTNLYDRSTESAGLEHKMRIEYASKQNYN